MLSQPYQKEFRRAPAVLTAGVLVGGFVFSMAMTLPGELSYDSVIQLLEGRTAAYSGWHPPVMSWLLGLADAAWPGAALFVLANAAMMLVSMLSLLRLSPYTSWAAPVVALGCILLPQFAIYQGIVWKDVLFANAAIAGFIALAQAAVRWPELLWRVALLATALVLLIIAALARQNGPIMLVAAAVSFVWILRDQGAAATRALQAGGAALLIALTVFGAASALLNMRTLPTRGAAKQLRVLEAYDLVAALTLDPGLQLPELSDASLLDAMRSARSYYSPVRSDTLARAQTLQSALIKATDDVLHGPWLDLVVHHTGLYLRERAAVFRWVFLTPDLSRCVPYVVGLRGPAPALRALGMQERVDSRDEFASSYGRRLIGTLVFSHPIYLALALLEFAFLLYRRRIADGVLACLLAGGMAVTASFLFVSIACDYRYLYFLDMAALIGLFYIAGDPRLTDGAARTRKTWAVPEVA
ncbi:MAG: hypothetical protein JOY77_04700 [Alphaproteobacteria bacterium]|nr:hypothetical protein [Alphaproteobacteria bacterium]